MKYLLLISLLCFGLTSCHSEYRALKPAAGRDAACIQAFKPQFGERTLYNTQVDVLNNHFSGLLFYKRMPDSSMRIVFANEMGFKFFDFEFSKDGRFTKYYIIPKMDKKAVIKTLQKDFSMILMQQNPSFATVYEGYGKLYTAFNLTKGRIYYITDTACQSLEKVQNGSKRKPVVDIWMKDYKNGVPDSIFIQHKKFKFNISSQRVQENVSK
ncbi:hypothetical protein LX64_03624 [Chitinophaga skermanii]|uniref:Lipoprotein n=1 Tax=Chitinophaga skermanii TaxID=331697 RepID=A0A327QFP8_9BACT|nr:hypothetical protein [Chitinophaga skermanii]RAJ02604.1 hypothetical protein LX64_03624 [Chitinophaga skermanii]